MKINQHLDAQGAATKTASMWKDPAFAAALIAPVAAAAVSGAERGIMHLMNARKKSQAFKGMLQENPHLQGRDAKNTQRYFNTLWATNPTMAQDPIVSGSFVYRQHGEGDEDFPHRGLMAGASEMARMRADIVKGAPRPSALGTNVGNAVNTVGRGYSDAMKRDLIGAAQEAQREQANVHKAVRQGIQGVQNAQDVAAGFDPSALLRQATLEPSPKNPGVVRRHRVKRASPDTLRALLGA